MNATITASLNQGIANGESLVGHERGDAVLAGQYDVIRQHLTLVGPQGQPLRPLSARMTAREVAACEGFIAAYRSGTLLSA